MRHSTISYPKGSLLSASYINQEVKTSVSGSGLYSFSPLGHPEKHVFEEGLDEGAKQDTATQRESSMPPISPREPTKDRSSSQQESTQVVKASFQTYKFPALSPFAGHAPKTVQNGIFLDDETPTHDNTLSDALPNQKRSHGRARQLSLSKKRNFLSRIDTSPNVMNHRSNSNSPVQKESRSSPVPDNRTHSSASTHALLSATSSTLSPIDAPSPSIISFNTTPTRTDSDTDSSDFRSRRSRKRKNPSSLTQHTGSDPTDLEQSRYYVNTLLSDTERNKRTREKIFEQEIARRGAPPPSVVALDSLGLAATEIPDKEPVTEAIDHILGNIGSLMGMSAYLKDSRGTLTNKFKKTVLHLEKRVTELQMLINEKDESLQRQLKREENTVKALEATLEGALIREKEMIEKYAIPVSDHRLVSIIKNTENTHLNSMVKQRWKEHHNLDAMQQQLWKEEHPIEAIQKELQDRLQKEHEKNTEQLRCALTSFQKEYMALFEQYKSIENRLKFYEKDKLFMKRFKGPEGKVTILFSDIESSTKYWERHEKQMAESVQIHNKLIRNLLEDFHGFETKTEGDAFMCAFSSPVEAVDFAMQVQLKLLELDWPEEILQEERCKEVRDDDGTLLWRGLRVRIGIHMGFPICSEDPTTHRTDYHGPCVNKAARVEGFADGGAVSVSNAVWQEIQPYLNSMRTKIWAIYLGKKEMKGIEEPDDIRLLLPATLRTRTFDEAEKTSRWDNIFSWASIQERQKELEGKMDHMKDEIHHTLHVSALESIIKEKDTVIQFLMTQLHAKNLEPDELTDMMNHYTKKIQERFDALSKEVYAKVNQISEETKSSVKESQKVDTLQAPATLSRPSSSKSTDGDDKKKKKKRRGSYMKPVELKSATMEISRETYNMMNHNLKYFKEQRDQAVKKQRNLAMDLLETQTKLHKLTRDVERFKKQVKVGGSFGVASPATDFRDLEKPKSIRVDEFSDSPVTTPSPSKRRKRVRKSKSRSKKLADRRPVEQDPALESVQINLTAQKPRERPTVNRTLTFDDTLEEMTDEEFMSHVGDDHSIMSYGSSVHSHVHEDDDVLSVDSGRHTSHEMYSSSITTRAEQCNSIVQSSSRSNHQMVVEHFQSSSTDKSSLLKRSFVNRLQQGESVARLPATKPTRPPGAKYKSVESRFMSHFENSTQNTKQETSPDRETDATTNKELQAVKPHLIFFQLGK